MKKISGLFFVAMILVSSNVFGMRESTQIVSWEECPKVEDFFGKYIKDKDGWCDWFKTIIPAILDGQVDPNIVDEHGHTALHKLCMSDLFNVNLVKDLPVETSITKLLKMKDVNPNILDKVGMLPLGYLVLNFAGPKGVIGRRFGEEESCEYLGDYDNAIVRLLKLFVENNANLMHRNRSGENILHLFCMMPLAKQESLKYLFKVLSDDQKIILFKSENSDSLDPVEYAEKKYNELNAKEGRFSAFVFSSLIEIIEILKSEEIKFQKLLICDCLARRCAGRTIEEADLVYVAKRFRLIK